MVVFSHEASDKLAPGLLLFCVFRLWCQGGMEHCRSFLLQLLHDKSMPNCPHKHKTKALLLNPEP